MTSSAVAMLPRATSVRQGDFSRRVPRSAAARIRPKQRRGERLGKTRIVELDPQIVRGMSPASPRRKRVEEFLHAGMALIDFGGEAVPMDLLSLGNGSEASRSCLG
jgi:hypothetical protein